jgi:hypothetical protein
VVKIQNSGVYGQHVTPRGITEEMADEFNSKVLKTFGLPQTILKSKNHPDIINQAAHVHYVPDTEVNYSNSVARLQAKFLLTKIKNFNPANPSFMLLAQRAGPICVRLSCGITYRVFSHQHAERLRRLNYIPNKNVNQASLDDMILSLGVDLFNPPNTPC